MGFMLAGAVHTLGGLPAHVPTTMTEALAALTDVTCGTLTCKSLYGGAVNQIKINALSNPTITGNASIPVGSATRAALDLKANAADVYSKTDMDPSLFCKASTIIPTFTGNVSTPSLTVNNDTALN